MLAKIAEKAPELVLWGIAEIRVEFDGSGDSGGIESVEVTPLPGHQPKPLPAELEELVGDLALEMMCCSFDNDGAFGHLHIDLTNMTIDFEERYRETVDHLSDACCTYTIDPERGTAE